MRPGGRPKRRARALAPGQWRRQAPPCRVLRVGSSYRVPTAELLRVITLKDGSVRYRLVVDVGRDENGKRKQLTRTFNTQREARDELSTIRHKTSLGTYVRPSKETLNTFLDGYLKDATRGLRASTIRNYQDAFRPVRERLGDRPLQSITKTDVDDLMDWMVASGRRRGGKPGSGLSGRTARLTLGRLTTALEVAVLEGKLPRNVARLVKAPKHVQRERETWSKSEVRTFMTKASRDRLHAAWRLSLYGLRRGEVLSLRWPGSTRSLSAVRNCEAADHLARPVRVGRA